MFAESTRTRRTPLAVQLLSMLAGGAIGVALIVAQVVTDRSARQADEEVRDSIRQFAAALARRAAPLLHRGDDLRLAVLASSVADVSDARVLLLDRDGVVELDTGLTSGGRKLPLATADGLVARRLDGDVPIWEVCSPALSNAGFVGEARLQYRIPESPFVPFAWDVFGITLLGCLSLVVLAWWLVHHWSGQLRGVARSVQLIREAIGSVGEDAHSAVLQPPAPHGRDALSGLSAAIKLLGEDLNVERHRSREAGLELARRVVRNLEQRGLALQGHGDRTRRYALMIAEAIQLPDDEWHDLGIAASLVDLGRAGVRASALTKTHELSDVERESLRYGPGRGAGFLVGLPCVAAITLAIRHHHEKYDGGGYPDGLRGARIPVVSRILAVADAYDLLTEGEGVCWPDAIERLRGDCGEHFDPAILDAFEAKIRENPIPRSTESAVILHAADRCVPYKLAEEVSETGDLILDAALDDIDDFVRATDIEIELLNDESESQQLRDEDVP